MTTQVLVVGGAGYIGSHMVQQLCDAGFAVAVLDDLSAGFAKALPAQAQLFVGDMGDAQFLARVFASCKPHAVLHFASLIQVGESMRMPLRYYQHNVAATLVLLQAMHDAGVNKLIFSSTAAIFGNPQSIPIDETHPKQPINPYGQSKWMVEQILADADRAHGLKSVCLRYFNAAGADPQARRGECHDPETHLIPLILQAASGRRTHISIYGDDYPTADGTCVRDYIHVEDLCQAHLLALQHLLAGKESAQFNLGNGQGFSVREVITAAEAVSGRQIPVKIEPRRAGDPPVLIADSTQAQQVLGWQPRYPDLHSIIRDAWQWEQAWPWFAE